ncbi:MAG TPA: STAS domain-containing protein [Bryobacteraceae bacterium]|nr:STAS domain-containing protein [Bryobacteraceae bacterium]
MGRLQIGHKEIAVRVTKDESGRVLKIAGSLDIGVAEELHRALRDFVCQESGAALDLTEVDECDTAVLQLFYSARKTLEGSGRSIQFAGLSHAVRQAGADLGLSLTGSADDAV